MLKRTFLAVAIITTQVALPASAGDRDDLRSLIEDLAILSAASGICIGPDYNGTALIRYSFDFGAAQGWDYAKIGAEIRDVGDSWRSEYQADPSEACAHVKKIRVAHADLLDNIGATRGMAPESRHSGATAKRSERRHVVKTLGGNREHGSIYVWESADTHKKATRLIDTGILETNRQLVYDLLACVIPAGTEIVITSGGFLTSDIIVVSSAKAGCSGNVDNGVIDLD